MSLIKCESCGKHIQSSQVAVRDKQIKPGIQKKVWKCPHCKHEYLITVTDKKVRRMMQDNKKDRERIKGIHNKSKLLRNSNKLTAEQAQKNAEDIETVSERINKRIEDMEHQVRMLKDEHKEAL